MLTNHMGYSHLLIHNANRKVSQEVIVYFPTGHCLAVKFKNHLINQFILMLYICALIAKQYNIEDIGV